MAFKFKKFELPDSGEFSDVDRKGMELLGKHINDQLEMLAEGIKSEEEIVESGNWACRPRRSRRSRRLSRSRGARFAVR